MRETCLHERKSGKRQKLRLTFSCLATLQTDLSLQEQQTFLGHLVGQVKPILLFGEISKFNILYAIWKYDIYGFGLMMSLVTASIFEAQG